MQEITDPTSGEVAYLGLWVDGVQVAAAMRQDDFFAERHGGHRWHLWTNFLKIFVEARPAVLPDEQSARGWLKFIGDCVEGKLTGK